MNTATSYPPTMSMHHSGEDQIDEIENLLNSKLRGHSKAITELQNSSDENSSKLEELTGIVESEHTRTRQDNACLRKKCYHIEQRLDELNQSTHKLEEAHDAKAMKKEITKQLEPISKDMTHVNGVLPYILTPLINLTFYLESVEVILSELPARVKTILEDSWKEKLVDVQNARRVDEVADLKERMEMISKDVAHVSGVLSLYSSSAHRSYFSFREC